VPAGELDDWLAFRQRIQATYDGVERWGHGRADAVGVILATTAAVADPAGKVALPPSNAPVSFPFIWNTNQQERLQHNGIVANGDDYGPFAVTRLGALIRNWTEVFGVFASARLAPDGNSLRTSANIANLLELEQILARLRSPRWPAAFGPLDGDRIGRGAALYREHCLSCHGIADASDLQTPFPLKARDTDAVAGPFVLLQPLVDVSTMSAMQLANAPRTPGLIGTDPLMACNAAQHIAPTGLLDGKEKRITIEAPDQPVTYGTYAMTTELLTTLMLLDMTNRRSELLKAYVEDQIAAAGSMILSLVTRAPDKGYEGASYDPASPGDAIDQFLGHCADETVRANMRDPNVPLPAYKARPLNGIWATAPYLHNGSVPTLADLLLPPAQRPRSFGYLDGAYDVAKAGLLDRAGDPRASILRTHDDAGQPILGNFNGGHDYGTALGADARSDLVEYLKSL
ncbi:MAG: di-heme-cytochrome C peroxidase, partial [Rhizobiaceae bacterium]